MTNKVLLIIGISIICNKAYSQTSEILEVSAVGKPSRIYTGFGASINVHTAHNTDDYILQTDNGKIFNLGVTANYFPENEGRGKIYLKKIDGYGDTVLIAERTIFVHPIPKPKAFLNGKSSGEISKRTLIALDGLTTQIEEVKMDVSIRVNKFQATILRAGKVIAFIKIEGSYFSDDLKRALKNTITGDILLFSDIEAETNVEQKKYYPDDIVFSIVG